MTYKIIQWGTGSVGKVALREILSNPEFALIGVKVYGDKKVGQDAGDLCGRPKTGILAVKDPASLPIADADCVLYTPMVADYDEIASLLGAGANVVTTASNVYPKFYGPEVFDKLQRAALSGNSTFHGSGINPAFMSEVLPLTLSGLSHRAKQIIVREVSDVNHYASTAPEIMLDHVGFGKTPEAALGSADAFLKGMNAYFGESILMICDHLGVTLDRIENHHEVAVAKSRVTLDCGRTIEPGTVGCRRFEWRGIVAGKPAIILSTYWKTTMDIDPAWDVESSRQVEWTVTVEGTPSVQCKVGICASFDPKDPNYGKQGEEAAVTGTATHAVNAIPYVCDAESGIKTFLDLTIMGSRGAFRGL
jgi:hypothetical protein